MDYIWLIALLCYGVIGILQAKSRGKGRQKRIINKWKNGIK